MRTAQRRQTRNKAVRTLTKTDIKKANTAISSGDAGEAEKAVKGAISTLDRAAAKKVVHKNNTARKKSRLMKKLNKMQAGT